MRQSEQGLQGLQQLHWTKPPKRVEAKYPTCTEAEATPVEWTDQETASALLLNRDRGHREFGSCVDS